MSIIASRRDTTTDNVTLAAVDVPETEPAPEVDPARAAQIRQWDEQQANKNRPWEEDRAVAEALRGNSSLGALTDPEQRYLIETTTNRWLNPRDPMNVNWGAIDRLGYTAAEDPRLSRVVSETYGQRAAALMENPNTATSFDNRTKAAALSVAAVNAAGTPENQRALLEKLGPQGSAAFASALQLDTRLGSTGGSFAFGSSPNADQRVFAANRMLQATAGAPPTASSAAFVDQTFRTISGEAFKTGGFLESPYTGNTHRSMAAALANQWHGNDPAKRDAEAKRLESIFRTQQGRDLLFNDKLPLETRVQNMQLVASRPEWDENFFKRTDGIYDNPEVAFALFGPTARDFQALRGDNPQTLSGTDLENTIGFSMGFPPTVPANETPEQQAAREAAVARGEYSYYQGEPASAVVRPVANAIRNVGGDDPRVTVLPVQYASTDTGAVSLTLYRVQDKNTGEDRFVDNQGRIYNSFEEWKNNNNLPPGNMTYPVDGHLSNDVRIETRNTPRTADTPIEHIKNGLDNAALIGGTIAGGALLLGSGGVLAPAVLGAAGAWQVYRGAEDLNDRYRHGQSINPFTDPGARSAWLNVGAGALSVTALGATGVAGRLAARGSAYSPLAATTAGFLRTGAAALDAGAAADAGHRLLTDWDRLSGQERAQLALSLGFWGASAAATPRVRPFDAPNVRSAVLAQRSITDGPSQAYLNQLAVDNPRLYQATGAITGPNADLIRLRALGAAERNPQIRQFLENGGDPRLVGELGETGFTRAFGDTPLPYRIQELEALVPGGQAAVIRAARDNPDQIRAAIDGLGGMQGGLVRQVLQNEGIAPAAQLARISADSPDGLGYLLSRPGGQADVLAQLQSDPAALAASARDYQGRIYMRAADGTYLLRGDPPPGAPPVDRAALVGLAQRAGIDPAALDNLAAHPDLQARLIAQMRSEMTPDQRAALDLEIYGRRFVDEADYEAARQAGVLNPEYRYGQRDFDNWMRAQQMISEAAARGEPLTLDLIQRAHAQATEGFLPEWRQGVLRSQPGDDVNQGGQGMANVQHVSPDQLATLRSNPDLRVYDLGVDPDGNHIVSVGYTDPDRVRARTEEVLGSIDQRLAAGEDPIAVAADVQRQFVSIHPFFDGNGRTSRLVMDYVLQRAGYPPSVLRDPNADTHLSLPAWTNEVRSGINRPYQSTLEAWARAQAAGGR